MGREVRRVPANWQHPRKHGRENGPHIPLHEGPVEPKQAAWDHERMMWNDGFRKDFITGEYVAKDESHRGPFEEWDGERPRAEDYMPSWKPEECTHLMMYEDTSEGTPISPAFATPEELARWLADNGASSFGSMTATYEQWLATCRRGYSVGAVYTPQTGLISGVEYEGQRK